MSDKFRKRLIEMINDEIPVIITSGEVVSVNEDDLTAIVKELRTGLDFLVKLNAGKTEKKVIVIPKVGSFVLVGIIYNSKQSRFIVSVSEVDKVIIDAETSVVFNGGENGGLCITPTLKTELDKNNAILTAILNVLNGAPVMEPGTAPSNMLQTALKTAVTGKQVGDITHIEKSSVKH